MSNTANDNSTEKRSFVFNREFKLAGLARLISQPPLTLQIKDSLTPELFNTKEEFEPVARLAKLVIERVVKKGTVSVDGLAGCLQLQPDGGERDATIRVLEEIRSSDKYWKMALDDEFFQCFLDYVKMNRIYAGCQSVVDKFRKGELEEAFQVHEKVESDIRRIAIETVETIDWSTALSDLTTGSENIRASGLRIGIPSLDDEGGFAPRTTNVFAANTGGGKGMMTIHLARCCIAQKKPVYIAVVEDDKPMWMRRLISAETGILYSRIKSNFHNLTAEEKERVASRIKEIEKYVEVEFLFGSGYKQIFERFRSKQAERKKLGLPTYEAFILDYLAHAVKSVPTASQQEHQIIERAMRDLRDFSLVENLIVFTHWQLNTAGKTREENGELITKADISGGASSINLVDNAIGINRSNDNKKRNVAILSSFKEREGDNRLMLEVGTMFETARFDFRNPKDLSIAPMGTSNSRNKNTSTPPPPPAPRQPFVASGTKPVLTGAPPQKPQQ